MRVIEGKEEEKVQDQDIEISCSIENKRHGVCLGELLRGSNWAFRGSN